MSPPGWPARLDACDTESAVLDATREFLATLDPADIARLPETCRPRRLVDANDVAGYAMDLMHHHCGACGDGSAFVDGLAAFLAHASMRLSRILARAKEHQGGSRESA